MTASRIAELEAALKPFALIADMEERVEAGMSVMVNVSRCRDARAALSAPEKTEVQTATASMEVVIDAFIEEQNTLRLSTRMPQVGEMASIKATAARQIKDALVLASLTPDPTPASEAGGEPVAWQCYDLICDVVSVVTDKDHAAHRARQADAWKVTPLYASPPAPTDALKAAVEAERRGLIKAKALADLYADTPVGSDFNDSAEGFATGFDYRTGGCDNASAIVSAIQMVLDGEPLPESYASALAAIRAKEEGHG